MSYQNFGVTLSEGQSENIVHAAKNRASVTIRLTKDNLRDDHKLPLTRTQINRISKSKTGLDLTLSCAQLNISVQW
jgi:hypothetical protein